MGKYFGLLMAVTSLVACKSTNGGSSAKDIKLVNTQDASNKVVYEHQGIVYLKTCESAQARNNRNCKSDEEQIDLELSDYLNKLPFNTGPYERNTEELEFVTKALEEAKKMRKLMAIKVQSKRSRS